MVVWHQAPSPRSLHLSAYSPTTRAHTCTRTRTTRMHPHARAHSWAHAPPTALSWPTQVMTTLYAKAAPSIAEVLSLLYERHGISGLARKYRYRHGQRHQTRSRPHLPDGVAVYAAGNEIGEAANGLLAKPDFGHDFGQALHLLPHPRVSTVHVRTRWRQRMHRAGLPRPMRSSCSPAACSSSSHASEAYSRDAHAHLHLLPASTDLLLASPHAASGEQAQRARK